MFSSITVFAGSLKDPSDDAISFAVTLPKTLSLSLRTVSPPSIIDLISMPLSVSQSTSLTTKSCATSTSLLVKYPELAVLRAVSAKPFLAP